MRLHHPDAPRAAFDAIAFKQAHWLDEVKGGSPFSVLFTLEENTWKDRTTIQMNIKDIKAGVSGLLVTDPESVGMEAS